MQEEGVGVEGLTNEGRHNLLLLHKQAHDKRGITESLHAQSVRWAYFQEKYHNSRKYTHPPLLGATEIYRPWEYFREITIKAQFFLMSCSTETRL